MAAARQSFLDGADWAYATGMLTMLIGAALVLALYPRKAREHELFAEYARADAAAASADSAPADARENG